MLIPVQLQVSALRQSTTRCAHIRQLASAHEPYVKVRDVGGGVVEHGLEDAEERRLVEHADEPALVADAVQHLQNTVVRVRRVLLVLAQQRRVGLHHQRLCEPTRVHQSCIRGVTSCRPSPTRAHQSRLVACTPTFVHAYSKRS